MKAVDFVKKSGWDDAIALVNASNICGIDKSIVDIEELKRLVESHELVEAYGGVSKAKDFILPYSVDQLSKKVYSPMLRVKQAIADVESCQ